MRFLSTIFPNAPAHPPPPILFDQSLKGRGMVWEKAKENLPPTPTITPINPDALPLGIYEPKIVARIGKHSTKTILRKSREL